MRLPECLRDTHVLHRRGRVAVLVRRDWEAALPVGRMLEGLSLEEWGRPVRHALRGRGEIHVLGTARGEIVAKRLERGGLIGPLLRRSYFDARRPLREAEAAERLSLRGGSTPVVVAARMTRRAGMLFALELATERVHDACEPLDALRGGMPAAALARALGEALRRAHEAGLHHRDLQVRNLLVRGGGAGGIVILDLDRCVVAEPPSAGQRLEQLVRLGRSAVKSGCLPGPRGPGMASPWAARAFCRGYGPLAGRGAPGLFRVIASRLRREVGIHRLLWPSSGG